MQAKVLRTMEEAVADIPDGASILRAGFGPGTPWNLLRALYEQGARELTLICNSASRQDSDEAAARLQARTVMPADRPRLIPLPQIARHRALFEKFHNAEAPPFLIADFCICTGVSLLNERSRSLRKAMMLSRS